MSLWAFLCGRQKEEKLTPLAWLTFYIDTSLVCRGDRLYIAQAQTESLYIMHVTGVYPVEFIKDMLLILFGHTYSFIFYRDFNSFTTIACDDPDLRGIFRILVGIVQEVIDDVGKMGGIPFDIRSASVQLNINTAFPLCHLQIQVINSLTNDFMHIHAGEVQLKIPFINLRHLQHLLYLLQHTLVLLPDDADKAVDLAFVADHFWAGYRVCGKGDGCDRGLKLMGHVVDEISLHL